MTWLNYHHLLYFRTTARAGTMSAAAKELKVSLPTVSNQIRELESRLGGSLFERRGKGLRLTALGRQVFEYADEIFTLGEELAAVVDGKPGHSARRFTVGVVDVLPKLVAARLLEPALGLADPVQLVVRQGSFEQLLGLLSTHRIDMVLADSPVQPHLHVRAYNHELGVSPLGVFAITALARQLRAGFPATLHGAPLLVPTEPGMLRRALAYWLEERRIVPRVVAEVEDSSLMKALAQSGAGAVVAPLVIETQLRALFGLERVGVCDGLDERYYAISAERRIRHPAVAALVSAAAELLGSA